MRKHLKAADDPEQSVHSVGLEPGDDALDALVYYMLNTPLKSITERVETVEHGDKLRLW